MKKQCYVFIKCLMVLCITVIAVYTASAQAQTNQVHAFADRNIIPEGTVATIVIESTLTAAVTITPSISGLSINSSTTVEFSVASIGLSQSKRSALFTVSVPDNDEPQAHETFTVSFTSEQSIGNPSPLTFTIPPNDLIAFVSPPLELSIDNTMDAVMIDTEPPLQSNKSFIISLMNTRLIITTAGIITLSRSPFPIDVALNPNNLLGPAEQLSLTIDHIDTWQPFTKPTAQAQISAGSVGVHPGESNVSGGLHTCAVSTNNTIACWGDNTNNRSNPTSAPGIDDTTRFLAVSAGGFHGCGVTADHQAACWGNNTDNRSNPTSAPDVDATTRFLAVSAGFIHTCGIKADGRLACWGSNVNNRSSPTSSSNVDANTRFLAVSAGNAYTCGIKADGRVTCWGGDTRDSTRPTSADGVNANTRFLTVSPGWTHTCGIKADGRVTCWGQDIASRSSPTSAPGVDDTTRFLAVSAGFIHTCGITTDRRVACWGSDSNDESSPTSSPDVNANTRFLAVSAGRLHTCGITTDRRVACWGLDTRNQSNPTSVGFQQANTTADVVHLAERSTIISNAVNLEPIVGAVKVLHSQLSLDEGESIMTTLLQATEDPISPITITLTVVDNNRPAAVSVNPKQVVLTAGNKAFRTTITAIDNNVFADIDPVTIMLTVEPREQVLLTPQVTSIPVMIANDDIYNFRFVQQEVMLAEGQSTQVSVIIDPAPPARDEVIVTFPITTDAVHRDNQLNVTPVGFSRTFFNRNTTQARVAITAIDDMLPEDTARFTVSIAPPPGIVATVANTLAVEVVADTDPPIVEAYTASNILPEGSTATVVINATLKQAIDLQLSAVPAMNVELSRDIVSLDSGISSVPSDVSVIDNDEPQASNNSFDVILTAAGIATQTLTFTVPPNDLTAVVTQAATFKVTDINPTMSITITPPLQDNKSFIVASTDSRLITTGIITQAEPLLNLQLSLQEGTRLNQPQQLDVTIHHIDSRPPFNTPTAQAQLSAAAEHSCAITANNTVACWGNSSNDRTNPASADGIDDATRFLAISAAAEHSCAITSNNTVACWGNTDNDRTNPASSPNVNTNTKFLAIDAGGEHSCAIKADNTAACWGNPDNDRTDPASAAGIDDDTRFLAIRAGDEHSCGITAADSIVACWGTNANDRTDPTSADDVDDNTKFLAISTGGAHSCGIKADSTVACWGDDTMNQSSPTSNATINDNTRFIAISAGSAHSCGIRTNRTAVCWGNTDNNRTNPASHPNVNANTRFLAISAGNEHSCGITMNGTVVCWGSAGNNRTNPASAGGQQANTSSDMVYLTEQSQIIPGAVVFEEVIEVTVPQRKIMLDRNETTTLTLFALASIVTEAITIGLQIQNPNEQEVLSLNRQRRTLTNTRPNGDITLIANPIAAETYIEPVRLILEAITGNVRLSTDTITVAIANPGLHRVSLATPDITIAEGTTRIITLNIEPPSSNSITINLRNSSTDQITVSPSATFIPGSSMTTATVSVIDDNDKERAETHIVRLTAAEADARRTYISTPELAVTVPTDNDRNITIIVSPTSLELSPDDSATIHLAVPPRFAITAPTIVAANTSAIIAVNPMQVRLNATNTSATMTVTATTNTGTAAQPGATTITLTAISATELPQLTANNIPVTIEESRRGLNIKVKVYLEGALP